MRGYFIIFFFFLISQALVAQVDSTYIGSIEKKFAIKGYFGQSFVMLMHRAGNNDDYTYAPNNPISMGGGFMWKNTALSLSFGYGFSFLRDKERGKTKAFDFQFHSYGRMFTYDIYIQKYKGFYNDDKGIILYPDLKIEQYGLNWQYVFNKRKFSYMAAFDQNERQRKSAGSFLLGGGVYQSKIESDSAFVVDDKKVFRNFQFGLNTGYAHTWVLGRRWFVSGSLSMGINFGTEKFNKIFKQPFEVSPSILTRIAAGYNRDSWALGFSFVDNILFHSFSNESNISLNSGNFQFTFIKRFDTIPFLPEKYLNLINKLFP